MAFVVQSEGVVGRGRGVALGEYLQRVGPTRTSETKIKKKWRGIMGLDPPINLI